MEKSEFQITGNIEDNLKIIFLISQRKHNVVTPHWNCLDETVLMMGHNMLCYKISLNYPFYPFLSGALKMIQFSNIC